MIRKLNPISETEEGKERGGRGGEVRGGEGRWCWTHSGAAEEDNEECLSDTGDTDDPTESEEENDTKNVLESGEVDSHDGTKVSLTCVGGGAIIER